MIITNTISPIAVPTFFAISGFLFFGKKCSNKQLIKYVFRILKLYLVWTVLYFPLIIYKYWKYGLLNTNAMKDFIQNFFFGGSYYHLWYLPSLIAAITIVFFLSKRFNNQILIALGVVLYVFGTLVDTYSFISPLLEMEWYKSVFLTTRNGLFFGMFFIVIGKIFAENKIKKSSGLMVIGLVLLVVESYYLTAVMKVAIVNMNLASMVMVPALLMFFLGLRDIPMNGKWCRNMSTVMYCSHPFVLSLLSMVFGEKGIITMILVLCVTFIVSWICVKLSERIKLFQILY